MSSTNFVNGSTLSDAGWANDVDIFVYSRLTSVSGTNTIVGTGPVSLTNYAIGQRFTFIPAATNTGATTLNITPSGASALGAKNIFWNGVACVGGEIKINIPCEVIYDGTQFNILASSGVIAEVSRCAAYQWTTWNPSDVTGTLTNAPNTAVASSTATYYMSMANSSGTLTYTFSVAGKYLVTVDVAVDAAAATTSQRCLMVLGGNATRYITDNGQVGAINSSAQNSQFVQTFLVSATAGQTLTILPKGQITSGGTTANFVFSANSTVTYVGA